MNLNKFTEKAQEAVVTAQHLTTELNHAEVTPENKSSVRVLEKSGFIASGPGQESGTTRFRLWRQHSSSDDAHE